MPLLRRGMFSYLISSSIETDWKQLGHMARDCSSGPKCYNCEFPAFCFDWDVTDDEERWREWAYLKGLHNGEQQRACLLSM